jgi:hypothetical protein
MLSPLRMPFRHARVAGYLQLRMIEQAGEICMSVRRRNRERLVQGFARRKRMREAAVFGFEILPPGRMAQPSKTEDRSTPSMDWNTCSTLVFQQFRTAPHA